MTQLHLLKKTALTLAISQAVCMPSSAAVMIVDDLMDVSAFNDNKCTLREAVTSLNNQTLDADCGSTAPGANDSIEFAPNITGEDSIVLSQGQLSIFKRVSIFGPDLVDGSRLTIAQTNPGSRVIGLPPAGADPAPVVSMSRLKLSGGNTTGNPGLEKGGAIAVTDGAQLQLNDSEVSGNLSASDGGAFYVENSTLLVYDSMIVNNSSTGNGGGIAVKASRLYLGDTTLGSNSAREKGGGVFAEDYSTLTFDNDSTIGDNNYAGTHGGGLALSNSKAYLFDSSGVYENSAALNGGAIHAIEGSSITMNEMKIGNNVAIGGQGGGVFLDASLLGTAYDGDIYENTASLQGGGISAVNDSNVLILNQSALTENTAGLIGGAIAADGSFVRVRNSSIREKNEVLQSGMALSGGGAISAVSASQIEILTSQIKDNVTSEYGGAILAAQDSTVTIQDSEVLENTASYKGGGIFFDNATVTISNSTVSGNQGSRGGAAYGRGSDASISVQNATLSDNYGQSFNGGIGLDSGSLEISNSLLLGNRSGNGYAIEVFCADLNCTFLTGGVNVFGSSENLTQNTVSGVALNPSPSIILATSDGDLPTPLADIIGPLATNGSRADSEASFTHALQLGSPAIDRVIDTNCPKQDQRGVFRDNALTVPIVSSNGKVAVIDLGGFCDIGSVEFKPGD